MSSRCGSGGVIPLLLAVAAAVTLRCHAHEAAFRSPSRSQTYGATRPTVTFVSTHPLHRTRSSLLKMADGDFGIPDSDNFGVDDDDEDDDDAIDPDSLGDWRAFRRNLAQSGIETPESSGAGTDDGSDEETKKSKVERKSVSKRNEALLEAQSEALAKEYKSGVWAHEAPNAEVGGLICRLPLEAEIHRNTEHSLMGQKLETRLSLDDGDGPSEYYGDDVASGDDGTGTQASEPLPLGASSPGVSFSPLAAQTVFWYRNAQSLIRSEMAKITAVAQDGQIDASQLSPEGSDMLNLYIDHQVSLFIMMALLYILAQIPSQRENYCVLCVYYVYTRKKYMPNLQFASCELS
mmetsp:Transcript_62313/g.184379  ORF Transcript_62313/g.184379 Transcript_62313/m.184379 type:complete len:349 (-) Transcript_62313:1344-2390(-)